MTFFRDVLSGVALWALVAGALPAAAQEGQTLKQTLARGAVLCGVNTGLQGFSAPDASGQWSGFDVDTCRALAAAIFDDPKKVTFVPLDVNERFNALRDGKVDVLSRNTTWSMSRETSYGLNFAAVSYYDGQGFMVRRSANKDTALDLGGMKVCVQSNTTTQLNLGDYFRANNMTFQEVTLARSDEATKAYDSGQCDVLTADVSQLYAQRLGLAKPNDHTILPDVISKEPLAPVVRHKDDGWLLIVKWTVYAMLNAEELGVTSKNVGEAMSSRKPEVMRLVGTQGSYGEELGLARDWAARIIRHVGNYGESYERNLGDASPLKIPRGLNQLWSAGGIQYAPPIR